MNKVIPCLALFLVSCSGSSGMSKEPDETNSTNNNNNLINFTCNVTSVNTENCNVTQNQNTREFYIFNPINNESTNNAPVVFSFHGGGGLSLIHI